MLLIVNLQFTIFTFSDALLKKVKETGNGLNSKFSFPLGSPFKWQLHRSYLIFLFVILKTYLIDSYQVLHMFI